MPVSNPTNRGNNSSEYDAFGANERLTKELRPELESLRSGLLYSFPDLLQAAPETIEPQRITELEHEVAVMAVESEASEATNQTQEAEIIINSDNMSEIERVRRELRQLHDEQGAGDAIAA